MKWELKLFITRAIKEGYDDWERTEVRRGWEGERMDGVFGVLGCLLELFF